MVARRWGTRDMKLETGGRRQETAETRQKIHIRWVTGDRRGEAGDKRQEMCDRTQEMDDRRQ